MFRTLKRAFSEFREDNGTVWAAALTYYAVLSLFLALAALVAIVGLAMDPETLLEKAHGDRRSARSGVGGRKPPGSDHPPRVEWLDGTRRARSRSSRLAMVGVRLRRGFHQSVERDL